jgi:hypothetical protein
LLLTADADRVPGVKTTDADPTPDAIADTDDSAAAASTVVTVAVVTDIVPNSNVDIAAAILLMLMFVVQDVEKLLMNRN